MAFLQEQLSFFFLITSIPKLIGLKIKNKLKLHSFRFRKCAFLNDNVSVNTKAPLKTAFKGSQITVILFNNFGNYIFNVATPKEVAQ